MIKVKKNSKSEEEHLTKSARPGKYRRNPSPHVGGKCES